MVCEHELEFAEKLTTIDQRSKSNTHRLDRLEENTAVLNRLATAVEVMATKQDAMGESVERLEGKVDTLESKPGKRWDGLVDKLILTVAAALIGFLLAQLGVA